MSATQRFKKFAENELNIRKLVPLSLLLLSSSAFAAGTVQFVNWYSHIFHLLGVHDHHVVHDWLPVMGAAFIFVFINVLGMLFRSHINSLGDNTTPGRSISLMTFVEIIMEFIYSLVQGVIGEHHYRKFLPLMCGIFIFIFCCNLSGLIPGFPPATERLNTNLAMGLTGFLV